ncbi:MAG: response regulator [bacterium]
MNGIDQGYQQSNERKLIRVAIVDDNEDIVSLLGDVLRNAGYSPDLFTSSTDALLASTSMEYDVIIADLEMPDVSGIDLLARVKQSFPLTQFIMITGYASVKSAAETMHRGAISYLTKPLSSAQILAHVEKAIENRLLSLENQRLIYELSTANQELEGKVKELNRLNDLLRKAQEDIVRMERQSAIGEVVVSLNHTVNNSISAIKAACRFLRRHVNFSGECEDAMKRIEAECSEIEAVMTRLRLLRSPQTAEYVDNIKMINLEPEDSNVSK